MFYNYFPHFLCSNSCTIIFYINNIINVLLIIEKKIAPYKRFIEKLKLEMLQISFWFSFIFGTMKYHILFYFI